MSLATTATVTGTRRRRFDSVHIPFRNPNPPLARENVKGMVGQIDPSLADGQSTQLRDNSGGMIIPIDSLSDPRVAPYRNLKDKELDRIGKLFIAEGEHLVRRLLASDFAVESVFVAQRHAEEFSGLVPDDVPLYVTSAEVMNGILGMKFHSGIIACGRRKPWAPLEEVLPRKEGRMTLVICPDINNVENIGSLIRLSAGFGVDAMILGERCHDPFWRQSIRVSMGTIFRLPMYCSPNLAADLGRLRKEWGVELAATVLDQQAEPLENAGRGERLGLLLGSEPHGLDETAIAGCDRKVTIPMKLGTDSLNVAVAAGIFLYHFTREQSYGRQGTRLDFDSEAK